MTALTKPAALPVGLLWIAVLTVSLIAVFASTACGESSSSSEAVSEAPSFELPVANGSGKISLDQYRGDKNVVLVFYRGFF